MTHDPKTGQKRKQALAGVALANASAEFPRQKKSTNNPNASAEWRKANKDIVAAARAEEGATKNAAWDDKYSKLRPKELVELFAQAIKKYNSELAEIEVEDRNLPAQAFENCTDFTGPRLMRNLRTFLEVYAEGGVAELSSCSGVGSPHTIILSPGAMRCMDVKRTVERYGGKDSKIAKLFGKHIKYKDAKEYVEKTAFGLAVGTAGRVEELITGKRVDQQQQQQQTQSNGDEEDEADEAQQSRQLQSSTGVLKLDCLKRIVLDASYQDGKKRGLLNDEAAFTALISLVNVEAVKLRLIRKETQILIF